MHANVRIKKLNNSIKKNGYRYVLVERTESKAIYQQEKYGFEVFKIKKGKPHPKANDDLRNYDAVERFPSDEDFGKSAWTYSSLDQALARYQSI